MAVDSYLKIDGIDGEATDSDHKNEIQILSYAWGGTQQTTVAGTGGSGAGKVDLSHLSIVKYLDKASPKLFKSLCEGKHIPNATLTAIKAGADKKPFLKITLGELFVTSIQLSASSEIPTESISFSYNTLKYEYSTQDDKGVVTTTGAVTYDTKQAKVS
jgi:type VI secretion system secreted protein Hcp